MASPYLEIRGPGDQRTVILHGDRVTVGKASANGVCVSTDAELSRMHAVFECFEAGWCVRDLGSQNGTFVNGHRVWDTHRLRSGDEIRAGATTLVFRSSEAVSESGTTETSLGRPDLTRRERDVLMALCRPLVAGDVFTEPASIKEIAKELFVTEAAVKQHLAHLYDKFGLHDTSERRRVRLANEALHRGSVTLGDLRTTGRPDLPNS
jgi:hypothetical protein